jgi:hypothetical protein
MISVQRSDKEVAAQLLTYGWLLISRNNQQVDVECIHCGAKKNSTWPRLKKPCLCLNEYRHYKYVPIVEHEYQCLRCGSVLVLCPECKAETNNKPICGVCSRRFGFPVFRCEDNRYVCLHILDRIKMGCPNK